MKICIPVEKNTNLKEKVFDHFGSAPYFLIYDIEKKSSEFISNQNEQHSHGMCNPLKPIENQNISAMICKGAGSGAIMKLNEAGIKIYRANDDIIENIITLFTENKLEEMTADNACQHHNCH